MNTQVESISLKQQLERAFEGLIGFASVAVVLAGTVAICFPALTLAGV
jgi:hypothetical protein